MCHFVADGVDMVTSEDPSHQESPTWGRLDVLLGVEDACWLRDCLRTGWRTSKVMENKKQAPPGKVAHVHGYAKRREGVPERVPGSS